MKSKREIKEKIKEGMEAGANNAENALAILTAMQTLSWVLSDE